MKLWERIWDWVTARLTRCCKAQDIKRHPHTRRLYCEACGMGQGEWKAGAEMNDNAPKDPTDERRAALVAIVTELREQNAHAGFERPDGEYVDVQLKAGDIRRAVAAVNAVGAK